MRMYRCTVQASTYIAVEAETLAEAERKIDDVLTEADEIAIIEHGGGELIGARGSISRSRIQVEH